MDQLSAAAGEHSLRVLVVDDDLSLLSAIERALLEAGERVIARGSFEEARRVLRDQVFDVLVTDIRLGAFNGLQLAVIARDLYPSIRVLVFSGFDDPVLRAETEHLGGQYLVKPVTSAHLLFLIRQPRTQDTASFRE
jgi:DNA-binding response OmpR family regulator